MSNQKTEKLIIIGSGPAALTAGVYAARSNLNPLLLEGPTPGGQLISTTDVENWPGETKITGIDLIAKLRKHAQHFGCRFAAETVTAIDTSSHPFTITTKKGSQLSALSVIIGVGAYAKRLNCPGEGEYWGKGVSVCAVCDGAFYKDQNVVVVGGGDTAMEDASFMTNFTDKITVVHILDKLSASPPMQQRVLSNPKTKIIYNSTVTEIKGDGDRVQEVVVTNQNNDEQQTLKTSALFVAIGMQPNTEFLQGVIELGKWGYINVAGNTKRRQTSTSVEGIFAAGDAVDYLYRQAVTASGTGCMAALDAEWYLGKLKAEGKG